MTLRARGSVWFTQVWALVLKECRQLVKDRALFAYTVFIFTLDIVIAASAATRELTGSAVAAYDASRSVASRQLLDRFHPPYFEHRHALGDPREAGPLLDRAQARVVLGLPHDFAERLARSQPVEVQLLVDTSDANSGYLVATYAQRIVAGFADEQAQRSLARNGVDSAALPEIRPEVRYRFNAALNELWFNTVSEMLTMVTIAAILLPAAALVRERERGTIEQLLVSPVTPLQLVLSKVLAMTFVMLVGTSVAVFGIMRGLYGVPFQGSVPAFLAVVALFAVASAGVGILAATFARTSGQVGLIVLLIVVPMVMLSGTWNMPEGMPVWLQNLSELSPLRHFIPLAYGITIRGVGLETLWLPLVKMLALGVVLFAAGVLRFRRQFR